MDLYESREKIEFKKAMESFYGIVFATNLNKGLTNAPKERIIKVNWNEDGHPRDENGRFASGSGSGEAKSASYSNEPRKDMDGNFFLGLHCDFRKPNTQKYAARSARTTAGMRGKRFLSIILLRMKG